MRTVILGVNDNPDYLAYIPHVQRAWNRLGWYTLTFHVGQARVPSSISNLVVEIPLIDGYDDVVISQTCRLLGHHHASGLLMTSDADMLPLSDYWSPDPSKITCYGYDLTGGRHFPMCYIAADASRWNGLVPENNIKALLDKYPCARSTDRMTRWYTDQNIITERLHSAFDKVVINRGHTNGLAHGRIDRANWDNSVKSPMVKIDAHMPLPYNQGAVNDLMKLTGVS